MVERPRIPTTGMRGGLGRTLLTAFLVLAIVPLSTVTWYATRRERHDIQREVTAKLSSVSTIMETQIRQWIDNRDQSIALVAALPATQDSVSRLSTDTGDDTAASEVLRAQLLSLLTQDTAFLRLAVLDAEGQVLMSTDDEDWSATASVIPDQATCLQSFTSDQNEDTGIVVSHSITAREDSARTIGALTGWLNPCKLARTMQTVSGLGTTGEIYLVNVGRVALSQGRRVTSPGIEVALYGENTEGLNDNYAGVPVIGIYRWLPDLKMVLVAEQAQEEAFAPTDNVTAAIIGATLGVALVTAVIAAIVTRQITRPIVRLTESALGIAEGDMEQHVPVRSRDEIGILAYVFNRMAAELKTLYDDLEEKVAKRTALLQKANYQIQRRAIQLATTVEVSQVATSILEPDLLLREVVRLVHTSFSYSYVGIYLFERKRQTGAARRSNRRNTGNGRRKSQARAGR